jgi:hypothetical protein
VAEQRWTCAFEAATGARAHANFASLGEARRFADRHALANGAVGEWIEHRGAWLLSTSLGDYLVTQDLSRVGSGLLTET